MAEIYRRIARREATVLERRSELLAYLVPAIVCAVAIQTWFEPGTSIAYGDLGPPVAPEADRTSHWNHLMSGEGAPTYEIVGLPYATWLDVWTWLGVGEDLAQRMWLSALFAGSAAAVVFLAFGFTSSSLAAGTAGLFASFNIYRLVTGPDSIPMAATLIAALLGGFVARAALRPERKPSVLGFAVASIGLGYIMANPPHVALVLLWVCVCAGIAVATQPAATRRTVAFLAKAAPVALLLNAWWIVPAWLTITAPGFEERFAAAGVEEWAWTHERATLANALTLNTTWAWSYPEFFPYAEGLEDSPHNLLKMFLPILALIGVFLARGRERRIALGLAITALVSAWLTTGLRAPVPEINSWLYENVPGYWLFREPTKLLLLTLLSMVLLSGLAVSRLRADRHARSAHVLAIGLAVGSLIYVYPMFTGEVIADERPLLPSAHVSVPDAWRQAAATLNSQAGPGKVLVLPRSDFYQVPTTWGYYGVPFTSSMIDRPVMEYTPGGYFRSARGVSDIQESIERDLLTGRSVDVGKKLAALGARYILLRRDIDLDFPSRQIARPKVLARSLAAVPKLRKLRSFGILEIYRLGGEFGDEVFAARPTLYSGASDALPPALGVVSGRPGFVARKRDQESVAQAGLRPELLLLYEEDKVRRVAVKKRGRTLLVRLADPFRLSIAGRELPPVRAHDTAVPLAPGSPLVVTAQGDAVWLRRPPTQWVNLGLLGLRERDSVSVWRTAGARSIDPGSGGPVGDCNAFDDRRPEQVGINAAVVARRRRPTLRLSANAHSACVTFPVAKGRSPDIYRVRFRYRQLQGSSPRACVWQEGIDRCAAVPALRESRTWRTFTATITPRHGTTALALFLYADGRDRGPATVIEYRDIRFERYRRAATVSHATRGLRVLPKGELAGRLPDARPVLSRPIDLRRAGPAGDCNRYDRRTPAQVGLAARVKGRPQSPVLQLAARDHSACVAFAITPLDAQAPAYRIRFEYRRLSGSPPRACLWQEGPSRCISLYGRESDSRWRVLDETVRLDPNVRGLRLFLYADGGADRATVAEYRNVYVGPVGSVGIVGVPRKQPLPQVVARREASWKFRVRITDAEAPFLLATSEAYAPGWKARADGRNASALRHVEVNGYANGWLVPWKGSYELTLEYEPERYAAGARWLAVVAPIVMLGWIGRRRPRWLFMRCTDWLRRRRGRGFGMPQRDGQGRRGVVEGRLGDSVDDVRRHQDQRSTTGSGGT